MAERSCCELFRSVVIFLIGQYLIMLLASEIYVWQLLSNKIWSTEVPAVARQSCEATLNDGRMESLMKAPTGICPDVP